MYCRRGRGRHWQISLLCFFKMLCTALFYFSVLRFHISHQRTQVYCCIVRERGRSPHPPLLTFCPASMLILIQIHAYTCTFPFFYFNLRNSLGQPLLKKEATDWDFIFCKSGWSTLAYNILRVGLEPQIKKAISDHQLVEGGSVGEEYEASRRFKSTLLLLPIFLLNNGQKILKSTCLLQKSLSMK